MTDQYMEKILIVDDEKSLLAGLERQFRGTFNIVTADGGLNGLRALQEDGPFAVIVSDMRMPEMNGIQLLMKAAELCPNTVRMMLTGNADLETATHAVNEGNIFRFLTKPCQKQTIEWTLKDGIKQYRLVIAEKEILEKTLNGSIQIMTDLLALVSPLAFSRASRLKNYVQQIAKLMKLEPLWQFELAAMLSQIGCVTIPPDTLEKYYSGSDLTPDEQEMVESHPKLGGDLLSKIPRLETVARMIARQYDQYVNSPDASQSDDEFIGGHLLKLVIDFDTLISRGRSKSQALGELKKREAEYHPAIFAALVGVEVYNIERKVVVVKYQQLNDTMILADNICARNNMLVVAKGQQVTLSMRALLGNYIERNEISEEFRVFVPVVNAREELPEPASLTS